MDVADLCSDDGPGLVDVKAVKFESDLVGISNQQKQYHSDGTLRKKSKTHGRRQNSEENRSSSALSMGQSDTSVLDQGQSPVDDSSLCSTSPICAAPLCRQFWKAGTYNDDGITPKSTYQSGSSYLHIHPKFLHSNATSHKWAFGAIAELLDNAVDEIQNGATFVFVDKTLNPRTGSSALLIQDDGGGMDPDAMRRCLSFGFSDKKSNSAIGQYGNGFKTSSMRLGADVIVFSRNVTNRILTQSIGLLSYTHLTQAGHDRIVVPMVNYEFNMLTGTFDSPHGHNSENSNSNLSVILQWSPYSTEEELLKQFDDVGPHGTKVIIYNLWFDDEGTKELDFESDPEDILIAGDGKSNVKDGSRMAISEQHIANRLRYSLRAYLSVLYLRLPETFAILLRGRVVEYHNIATDLKYPEFIMYKPQSGGCAEGKVVTTIGFLKEAPIVNVHGFNVYHKNRLILPFWRVVNYSDSRGRGVVGILEANFVEPTHNKQDFEKTSVFQKLENRLKEMTWEYWDYHCGLIGYQIKKLPRPPLANSPGSSNFIHQHSLNHQPVVLRRCSPAAVGSKNPPAASALKKQAALYSNFSLGRPQESIPSFGKNLQGGPHLKRKAPDYSKAPEILQQKAGMGSNLVDLGSNLEIQPDIFTNDQEAINVMQENKRLREQCLEYEKIEEELDLKVNGLKSELRQTQHLYANLLAELQCMEKVKDENNVLIS